MNRKTVKFVAKTIVGFSTSATTGMIVKNHAQPTTLIQKIEVIVAAMVAGGIAADKAEAYTDKYIDNLADSFLNANK